MSFNQRGVPHQDLRRRIGYSTATDLRSRIGYNTQEQQGFDEQDYYQPPRRGQYYPQQRGQRGGYRGRSRARARGRGFNHYNNYY